MHFCWEAMVHAHLLWDIPCIFVGRSYHMHIYCGAISCAFLLDHSPCTFIVGPDSMHFCWEIIAHAHLMRDQIPCIPVGRPCPERKFSGRLFPVQFSQRAISGAHLKICWEHHVQCAFAACNFCHCLPSQLGCRCAGTVRGVWLHGSQHVCTVHLRGGCAGQYVH